MRFCTCPGSGDVLRSGRGNLQPGYVNRLGPLGALDDFELYCLTFFKRPESVHFNTRLMDKYIFAFLVLDEPVALLVVEPFYGSSAHACYLQKTIA